MLPKLSVSSVESFVVVDQEAPPVVAATSSRTRRITWEDFRELGGVAAAATNQQPCPSAPGCGSTSSARGLPLLPARRRSPDGSMSWSEDVADALNVNWRGLGHAKTMEVEMPSLRGSSTRFAPALRLSQAVGARSSRLRSCLGSHRSVWLRYGFDNGYVALFYCVSLFVLVVVLLRRITARTTEGTSPPPDESRLSPDDRKALDDLTKVRHNSFGDGPTLVLTIVFTLVLIPCIYAGFVLLRRRYPLLYDGRRRQPLRTGRRKSFRISYTALETRVNDPEADYVIQTAGLDGWMQLRFYTLNCRLFATLGYLLMVILCPLHVYFGREEVDGLSYFGINTIARDSPLFWVHAAMVWAVVVATGTLLVHSQKRFLDYRYGWLAALPLPRATTLIVENIPYKYRTDAHLREFFTSIFPGEAVKKAYVVRRSPELRRKLQDLRAADSLRALHEAALLDPPEEGPAAPPSVTASAKLCDLRALVRRLSISAHALRTARRAESGEDWLRNALQKAKEQFVAEQKKVEEAAQNHENGRHIYSRNGFVTFSSRRWSALGMERRYRADAQELRVGLPPDPSDVIYKDLAASRQGARSREICGVVCLVIVFLTWMPIVAGIAGLTTLSGLQEQVPSLHDFVERQSLLRSLFEGPLATVLLKLAMAIMPNVLLQIIRSFFLLKAGSWAQLRLQEWFFCFQVIFVVLAAAFSRSLWQVAGSIMDNPVQVLRKLESQLPSASNFYLSYVVSGWSGTAVYLLRPIALAKYSAFRAVTGKAEATARAQDEHPAFFGTGVRMTKAATMTVVALVFCMLSPLICFFALGFFVINRAVYDYLLLRAEEKRPDLGGAYWVKALQQVFFGLLLFVVIMSGILLWRAGKGPAFLSGSSLGALYYLWRRFEDMEWKSLPLEKVSELDDQAVHLWGSQEAHEDEGYLQPECLPIEELLVLMERSRQQEATWD